MGRIYSDWLEIAQSCARVNAALTSFATWKDWRVGFRETDLSGEEEFGTGLRWTETRDLNGRLEMHELVVTDYIPNESISIIIDGDRYRNRAGAAFLEYRLVDYGRDTTLHLDTKLDPLPFGVRLFAKGNPAAFLQACREDLESLKSYLEESSLEMAG